MSNSLQRLLTVTVLVAVGAHAARALDSRLSLAQLGHTRWTAAEGAPSKIRALAQGRDGFLWIGAASGLYRFDGVVFEPMKGVDSDGVSGGVTTLLATRDGAIWAGYATGRIAVLDSHGARDVSSPLFADDHVLKLVQAPDGAVWAMLARPQAALVRFKDGHWREIGDDIGFPNEWTIDAIFARNGDLWVTTTKSVLVLRNGANRFVRMDAPHGHGALSEDGAGRIWISDDAGSRLVAPSSQGPSIPTPGGPRIVRAAFDRDGDLWGVNGAGVWRARGIRARGDARSAQAPQVEQVSGAQGLSSSTTNAILEDREGDIWVGTTLGLDRFRAVKVAAVQGLATPPTFGYLLFRASDGSVFIGARDTIYRVRGSGDPEPLIQRAPEARALCEGPDGAVWIFLDGKLLSFRSGRIQNWPVPAAAAPGILDCAVDARGVLWANGERAGLFSLEGRKWIAHPPRAATDWAEGLITGSRRELLLFLHGGRLARVDAQANPTTLLFREPPSQIRTVFQEKSALYVGGAFGLARVGADRVQVLSASRFPWIGDATGLVETSSRTWMINRAGVVSVDSAALSRAFDGSSAALDPTVLSFEDGLPNVQNGSGVNDAAEGGDGRLWFVTEGAVVWVDPATLARNTLPPTVLIRALTARGAYAAPKTVTLKPGVSDVSIQYTATSLSIPERVRFRYRLKGLNDNWIDAGGRRQADFTNLAPGTYRFQVLAANNDGVWNNTGAQVEFTIPPTFLQSIWFKFLVALAIIALVWAWIAARMRQEVARLQGLFDIRIAERERIARELHDTLLQSIQGLMLQFQSAANRVPAGGDLRPELDAALDRAEAVLVEGRIRVRELRATTAARDLAQSLVALAGGVIDADGPQFHVTVEGTARDLHALASEELCRIAEEAIRNATRHAQATTIEALISYEREGVRLTLRDDGIGIDAETLESADRSDHYGLVGIRERADRIGARLSVSSRKQHGTEVALFVPARAAYVSRGRPLLELLTGLWRWRIEH